MSKVFVPSKSSRIFVTGAGGFLGKHLIKELNRRGYKHILSPGHAELNLLDISKLQKFIQRHRPHIVIHLAAVCGGIGANMARPGEFFYKNLVMGVHLMELARLHGVEKFVAVGTVCAYPKFTPTPFQEDNLWDGYPEETNAPYGLAKKMLLVQSQAYRKQYGFNSIYLLPANMYGPGDHFDLEKSHVIPAMVRKFMEAKNDLKERVTLWGTGKASREFLYVEDAARAIVMAMEKYNDEAPVNIGSCEEITIKKLASLVCELVGFKGRIVWDKTKPDGQPRRRLDVSKARKKFGFVTKVRLLEGLKKTIAWYSLQIS